MNVATFANRVIPSCSAQPSARLRLLTLLVIVVEAYWAIFFIVAAFGVVINGYPFDDPRFTWYPWNLAAIGAIAAGLVWLGNALRRRRRSGGFALLALILFPLSHAIASMSLTLGSIVVGVLGIWLTTSVLHELE